MDKPAGSFVVAEMADERELLRVGSKAKGEFPEGAIVVRGETVGDFARKQRTHC